MSNKKSNQSYEDEDEFNWEEYLKKTNSVSAPVQCFCQHPEPPSCEFKVGFKLETYDPRNTTSTCIGTVIEIQGPRLRLRLDGTDDRNDFWLMCDSELIHPFEFSAKNGKKIQPPLGYGNDLSKWPRFLEKLINSAGDGIFAAETCFKTPPLKPSKNDFKLGQKLEAVDPKNPHLICPATIKDINREKIFISFDGWSHSSQFWCSYTSRDLFPVGWCKKAGHILQPPGDLDIKPPANKVAKSFLTPIIKNSNVFSSQFDNMITSKESNSKSIKKPKKSFPTSKADNLFNYLTNDNINNFSKMNHSLSVHEDNFDKLDLSVIKHEAIEPSEEDNPILKESLQSNQSNIIIYVNPLGDCGNLIKTCKFHTSHTKFGPGTPSNIYKSILQSFVDCANDRYEIFSRIPEGNSEDYVKLKTPNFNQRKKLISIENISDMWTHIKYFCNLIGVDDTNLLTKKSVFNNSTNKIQSYDFKSQNSDANITLHNVTLQPSTSTSENINENLNNLVCHKNSQKRSSLSISTEQNENKQTENSSKLTKYDSVSSEILVTDWSIDQVVCYVSQLSDNYFAVYVDIFKHHEIDGKALILLTTDILMKYMGFKLGPALKLNNYLDKIRRSLTTDSKNNIQNVSFEQNQTKRECNN